MQKRRVWVVVLSASLVAATLSLAPAADAAGRTVRIGDAQAMEGKVLYFPLTLSRPSEKRVQVDFVTVEGTADDTGDYVGRGGRITFRRGTTKRILAIATNTDAADEDDETLSVVLSSPRKAVLGRSRGTGTIGDDDGAPSVGIADASVNEAFARHQRLSFDATLSAPSGHIVTVDYTSEAATATAGDDYEATAGTVTFPQGVTSRTIDVVVHEDAIDEPDETLFVDLSQASNATLRNTRATGTIVDDDLPGPAVSVGDVSALEGPAGTSTPYRFPVTLSAGSSSPVVVDYSTAAATAESGGARPTGGDDFDATGGRVTFVPGDTFEVATVQVNGDDADEDDAEEFFVDLSSPMHATIADGRGVGTISDDDPTPTIGVQDASISESEAGDRALVFTATLIGLSSRTVTADFATTQGTANSDDFVPAAGTIAFAPGETTKHIEVAVSDDAVDEEDEETFVLTLSSPSNGTLADAEAVGTIIDDDEVTLSITDARASEGSGRLTFVVTLTGATARTVTVDARTTKPSGNHSETGIDYVHTVETLTFSPNTSTREFVVGLIDDSLRENDEWVFADLSGATNATISDARGVGTIVDDD